MDTSKDILILPTEFVHSSDKLLAALANIALQEAVYIEDATET